MCRLPHHASFLRSSVCILRHSLRMGRCKQWEGLQGAASAAKLLEAHLLCSHLPSRTSWDWALGLADVAWDLLGLGTTVPK